jgi:hypothetical protein
VSAENGAVETVEGTAVEIPTQGQAVVHHHHDAPVELFPGSTPAEIIAQATAVADALKPILSQQGMTKRIGPKDHVLVEGWQTLGALLKVTPVCVSTRPIEPKVNFTVSGKKKKWGNVEGRRQLVEEFDYSYDVEGYSWKATVEARTLDGRTIGSADAICSREEDNWKDDDDFALLSMAQTRASSKALASVLRFIVTLAGYSGTPAEEMHGRGGEEGGAPAPAPPPPPPPNPDLPEETLQKLGQGIGKLGLSYRAVSLLLAGRVGADPLRENTAKGISDALRGLTNDQATRMEAELERLAQDQAATAPQEVS